MNRNNLFQLSDCQEFEQKLRKTTGELSNLGTRNCRLPIKRSQEFPFELSILSRGFIEDATEQTWTIFQSHTPSISNWTSLIDLYITSVIELCPRDPSLASPLAQAL
ncbi:hypothetical protein JHK82_042009 [Glycine max]|uniref:Uncharacterized protein n=1 Tax=Glycine max TaxID=3847 RepID=A0A0R0GAA1_SOYBN|nr:hypothetical protein JHK87_041965 [Glycine soja]KAG4956300.1 hypothetical protein JHK85_042680 [Glycine max]KAG5105039.1 hypothetical protein JHK82_042009 [Glycine max]KAG5116163.1 hypothetical protein JHK84_042276 [Glycine max]KAH1146655.1 hypothetical protein GYH30_042031 [Glycine max]